jgi:hypothetical protein
MEDGKQRPHSALRTEEICGFYFVAPTGSRLYRGLAIRLAESWNSGSEPLSAAKFSRAADCQSATQQMGNLRYGKCGSLNAAIKGAGHFVGFCKFLFGSSLEGCFNGEIGPGQVISN